MMNSSIYFVRVVLVTQNKQNTGLVYVFSVGNTKYKNDVFDVVTNCKAQTGYLVLGNLGMNKSCVVTQCKGRR